ncbi:hypothetical protein F4859DRAFT_5895 [Xylaria cf. heliscus]|nr:hypothetical protein F4859DRAFT_5895 [Xylaria cf. heliscus]
MAQFHEAHGAGVEGAEVNSGKAQETYEPMEINATDAQVDTIPEPEPEPEHDSMDTELAKTKPSEAKTAKSNASEPKVEDRKSLPFNPAKIKAAAIKSKARKTTTTTTATPGGKKPTSTRKRRGSSRPTKRSSKNDKGDTPTLDQMLSEARKWIVRPTSYMLRNSETGCFGLSARRVRVETEPEPEAGAAAGAGAGTAAVPERSEITIAHGVGCGCLDARLLHVARHADTLVRSRVLARRFRDAFVIATKIRLQLPHATPKAARFPPPGSRRNGEGSIKRPRAEVEAEVAVINVVDVHRQQKLVEKWKSLEAFKKRRIWKDW